MAPKTSSTKCGQEVNVQEALTNDREPIGEPKTCTDTRSHISKLPQELLIEVFLIVQATLSLTSWLGIERLTSWHNVTYVCRHWRTTALNAAVLWTRPPTYLEKYTSLVLERAKSANLRIFLDPRASKTTINAVLGHIAHIQTLNIRLHIDDMVYIHDILLSCCNNPWPKLTNLDIDLILPFNRFAASRRTQPTMTLSPTVMHQLTDLRSLYLTNIAFDWIALRCPNLTWLFLTNTRLEAKVSWEIFLGVLNQMPHLERLAFNLDAILESSHAPLTHTHRIQLPCLEYLNLDVFYPYSASSLFSHMILPKLNQLLINIWGADWHKNADYSRITQTISLALTNGDFGHFDSISIAEDRLELYLRGQVFGVQVRFKQFDFDDAHQYIPFIQLFMEGVATIPTNNFLGFYEVNLQLLLSCDRLAILLGNLPQLKSLIIHRYPLCTSLAQALRSGTLNSSNPTLLFRTLEKIAFSGFILPQDPDFTAMQDLCASLLVRHGSGYGIKILQVGDCSAMPTGIIKQLGDVGICVVDQDLF